MIMPLSWSQTLNPCICPYHMKPLEFKELRKQLKELPDVGYIHPSKSPYGAPLNKITIKNMYPIPRIDDLFDQLGDAR